MKECDEVRVIRDRECYAEQNVRKGMVGTIMDPRSINHTRLVIFSGEFKQAPNGVWYTTDIECIIRDEDLEIVRESPP